MSVQIVDSDAYRVLAFAGAVLDQRYKLKLGELRSYAENPRGGAPFSAVKRLAWGLWGMYDDPITEWLTTVGFLIHHEEDDTISLSGLGRAVLSHLELEKQDVGESLRITLDPNSPFPYTKVIKRIAQYDKALLVDPYFDLEQLESILFATSVSRVLTSDRRADTRLKILATASQEVRSERPLEIRISRSKEMHDRYVIPSNGQVEFRYVSQRFGKGLYGHGGDRATSIRRHPRQIRELMGGRRAASAAAGQDSSNRSGD